MMLALRSLLFVGLLSAGIFHCTGAQEQCQDARDCDHVALLQTRSQVTRYTDSQQVQGSDDSEMNDSEEPESINGHLDQVLFQVAGKEMTEWPWDDAARKLKEEAKRLSERLKREAMEKIEEIERQVKEKEAEIRRVADEKARELEQKLRDLAEEKKHEVEDVIKDHGGDVIKVFTDGKKLFDSLKATYKDLEKFNKCLQDLPEKFHIDKVFGWAGSFNGDWGALADSFNDRYLKDAMHSVKGFAEKAVGDVAMDDLVDAADSEDALQEQLQRIIDKTWSSIQELTKQPGFEVSHCLMTNVLEPAVSKVKPLAEKVFLSLQEQLEEPMKQLQTKVVEKIAVKVEEAYTTVWRSDEGMEKLAAISSQAASVTCMAAVESTSDRINKLDAGNPNNDAEMQSLVTTLQGSSVAALPTAAGVAFVNLLEVWVGRLEEDVIDPLIRSGLDTIKSITTAVLHAVDGLCGLVPEVGAALCAILTTFTGAADIWVQSLSYTATKKLIHEGLMGLLDHAEDFVKDAISGVMEASETQSIMQGLEPIEKIFRKLGALLVPGVRDKLDACDKHKQGIIKLLTLAKPSLL